MTARAACTALPGGGALEHHDDLRACFVRPEELNVVHAALENTQDLNLADNVLYGLSVR